MGQREVFNFFVQIWSDWSEAWGRPSEFLNHPRLAKLSAQRGEAHRERGLSNLPALHDGLRNCLELDRRLEVITADKVAIALTCQCATCISQKYVKDH